MIYKFYTFLIDVRPYLFHDCLSLTLLFLKFLNLLILFSFQFVFLCLSDVVCVGDSDLYYDNNSI